MSFVARLPRIAHRRSLPGPLAAALAVVVAVSTAGGWLGFTSISATWAEQAGGGANQLFGSSLPQILLQNLSVVMFLYSGALTLGLTSIVSVAMLSAYVGATMAVGVGNVGMSSVLGDAGPYAALEFLGCLVAAAAGLCPLMAMLGRVFSEARGGAVAAYVGALRTSLATLAVGTALVVVAAAIEATLIFLR